MRNMMKMLSEIRTEQLKTKNAEEGTIQEAKNVFTRLDQELYGFGDGSSRLEEVMTTGDFTYAIVEFVQRQMFKTYNVKGFDFEQFIKPDTSPNFLPVNRYQRRGGTEDMEYVGEKGEARPGSYLDATKRQYQVYKWEKQFDFSMEALVNDDLGYFMDLTEEMGRTARRSLEKFVSRMLWNAVTVARLVALGALYSTTGRLNSQRVSEARMAFSQRVDARGNPIAVDLRYIVHHQGLTDTVRVIQASQLVPELATNAANVVASDFEPIKDPYAAGAAPNLPWFALTSWQMSNVIPFILARRAGMPAPAILRKKSDIESITSIMGPGSDVNPIMGDFQSNNVVFKIVDNWGTYIDTGTEGNLFDYQGAFYSDGTAA